MCFGSKTNTYLFEFIKPARSAGARRGPALRARALAKFTPVHQWEGGELKSGQKHYFLGECISGRF